MLNQDAFLKRLESVIQYYDLSASALADKIGVQRSSISHLLTGRNKPSLEFVMKLVHALPEVSLYWLLQGEGELPSKSREENATFFSTPGKPTAKEILQSPIPDTNISTNPNNKSVERIVFFYSDGSFESYSDKRD